MRQRRERYSNSRRNFIFGSVIGLAAAMVGRPLWMRLFSVSGPPPSSDVFADAGAVASFATAQPTSVFLTLPEIKARPLVYVSRTGDADFVVLSSICPHRNCVLDYINGETLFRCVCHNSWFEGDGHRGGGPAPRGMDPLPWRIENGRLLIRWQLYRLGIADRVAM